MNLSDLQKEVINSFIYPKEYIVNIIERYKNDIKIKDMLKLFNLPKTTYYRIKKNIKTKQQKLKQYYLLTDRIKQLCIENKFYYGSKKICHLYNLKYHTNLNYQFIYRVMKNNNWLCILKPKKCKHPILSGFREIPNLINKFNKNFYSQKPKTKLFTDITQFKIKDGNLYLSLILDSFNRKVISFKIDKHSSFKLVYNTFNQINAKSPKCLIHFDQRNIYRNVKFQKFLLEQDYTSSMSHLAQPNDNAMIEYFFGLMKSILYQKNSNLESLPFKLVKTEINNFISFYNKQWIYQK